MSNPAAGSRWPVVEQGVGDGVVESVGGVAGVGEHERVDAVGVESGGVLGDVFDGGVEVAVGVDAVVALVGVGDVGVAVAESERGVGFPRVGEAVEFGEGVGGDVGVMDEFGEHAAGVDGAELLVVADEHGPPPVRSCELVVGKSRVVSTMPASSITTTVPGASR